MFQLKKIKTALGYNTPRRRLDSVSDLTSAERSGLKEHGISSREFDKMDSLSQHEWKDELDKDDYYKNRKRKSGVLKVYQIGRPSSFQEAIWKEKKLLIDKIVAGGKEVNRNRYEFMSPDKLKRELLKTRWYYKIIDKIYIPKIKINFKKLINKEFSFDEQMRYTVLNAK